MTDRAENSRNEPKTDAKKNGTETNANVRETNAG